MIGFLLLDQSYDHFLPSLKTDVKKNNFLLITFYQTKICVASVCFGMRICFSFVGIELYKYLAMSALDVGNWWLPGEFSHYIYHNFVCSQNYLLKYKFI